MSHRKRRPLQHGKPPSTPAAIEQAKSAGLRSIKAWLAAVLLLTAAAAAVWFWQRPIGPKPPSLDLTKVDPTVARAIQRQLDEVGRRPRAGSAWGQLGMVLRAYDYKAEARRCLAEAERLNAEDPRWPYFHGLLQLIDTPAEALVKLRRTVQLCGNEPEAPRFRLARLLAEQGRWDEATPELEQLLSAKPDFAPARLLRAHGAQARSRIAEAIELARRCINDPRTGRSSWALLATLYRQQGDTAAATEAARKSASLPVDEGFSDPFEAEATLLRGDPRALSEHAHALLASGRLNEAARLSDRLVQEHPTYAETWLVLGRLELLRKDFPAAEQSLRRHLGLSRQSTQGLFQLGLALLNQNRFADAADTFLKATELKADFGPAFFNRGLALVRAGLRREAIPAFRESIRHNPEHIDSYLLLADLHLALGEKVEALKLLEQAQTIDPLHPGLRQLHERAGRSNR
ncbi:MAG: tetratricopeptide repeat protein [Verrucomicrobiota bacterium]